MNGMYEMDSGARTGRPALLLILSAVTLVGTLGAAWWQSADKRRLGDPRPVAGTPLIVRPPAGWVEDPRRPGVFNLYDPAALKVREVSIERRVIFRYERRREAVTAEEVIRQRNASDRAQTSPSEPARLAGLPARQVQRVQRFEVDGQLHRKVTLLRVAVSPWGDVVAIEYWPLTELSSADERLVEAIAAGVELSSARAEAGEVNDLPARVGVKLPERLGGDVFPAESPETPGLYVVLPNPDDSPAYIGVLRTWLAPGRRPDELLIDFADQLWGLPDSRPIVTEWSRQDRCNVAAVRVRIPGGLSVRLTAAYLLWESPEHAVLVHLDRNSYFNQTRVDQFHAFVQGLELTDVPARFDFATAASDGAELVAESTSADRVANWASKDRQAVYLDSQPGAQGARIDQSQSRAGAGVVGASVVWLRTGGRYSRTNWLIDERGRAFESARRFGATEPGVSGPSLVMTDRREAASGPVRRRVARGLAVMQEGVIAVGPGFFAPPAEPLLSATAARRQKGQFLVERLAPRRLGTASRLVYPGPPDAKGRPQVVIIDDFAPWAQVQSFDADFAPATIRTRLEFWEESTDSWSRNSDWAELVREASELLRN